MLDLLNIFKKQTPKLEDGGCMPDINQQLEEAGVFKSLAIAHYNSGMDDMALHRLNEQGGTLGSIPEEDFELLKHGIETFSFLLPPPVNKKHTLAELAKLIKETYSIENPKTLAVYDAMIKYGDVEITKKYSEGGDIEADEAFAVKQLTKIHAYAEAASAMLKEDTQLEAWLQGLVSKSEQMISDVKHALQSDFPSRFATGGEIDEPGKYVKSELLHIGNYANVLIKAIEDEAGGVKLEPWMKANISVVSNYIGVVRHYLEFSLDKVTFETGGLPGGFAGRDREHINTVEVAAYDDMQKTEFASGGKIERYKKGERFYDEVGNEYRYAYYSRDARGGGHYLNDMKNRGILVFGGEKKLSNRFHKIDPTKKEDGGEVVDKQYEDYAAAVISLGVEVNPKSINKQYAIGALVRLSKRKPSVEKDFCVKLLTSSLLGEKKNFDRIVEEAKASGDLKDLSSYFAQIFFTGDMIDELAKNPMVKIYTYLPKNFQVKKFYDGGDVGDPTDGANLRWRDENVMKQEDLPFEAGGKVDGKFTFKTEKPTGKWKSFDSATNYIKLNGKEVGTIDPEEPHKIWLQVIKKDITEDGNSNCPWKWIRLVKDFKSLQEAKDFLNNNYTTIVGKYDFYMGMEDGGSIMSYEEASILPKGGAVAMDEQNMRASAAEVIAKKHAMRPKAIYDWATKHGVDIVKHGYILSGAGTGNTLLKANSALLGDIFSDKYSAVKKLIEKTANKKEDGGNVSGEAEMYYAILYNKDGIKQMDGFVTGSFSTGSEGEDKEIAEDNAWKLFVQDKKHEKKLGDYIILQKESEMKFSEGGEIPATDIEVGAWVSEKHYESKPIDGELEPPTDGNNLRWWDETVQQLPGEVEAKLADGGKIKKSFEDQYADAVRTLGIEVNPEYKPSKIAKQRLIHYGNLTPSLDKDFKVKLITNAALGDKEKFVRTIKDNERNKGSIAIGWADFENVAKDFLGINLGDLAKEPDKLIDETYGKMRAMLKVKKYADGGELVAAAKTARVLIISRKNPLSKQLQKLTGDSWSLQNFDEVGIKPNGNPNLIKHKKSGELFVVFSKTYYDQVDTDVIKDDLTYMQNTHGITDFIGNVKKETGGSVADNGKYKYSVNDDFVTVQKLKPNGETEWKFAFISMDDAKDYVAVEEQLGILDESKLKLKEYQSKFKDNPNADWIRGEYRGDGNNTLIAGVALALYPNREQAIREIKHIIVANILKEKAKPKDKLAEGGSIVKDGLYAKGDMDTVDNIVFYVRDGGDSIIRCDLDGNEGLRFVFTVPDGWEWVRDIEDFDPKAKAIFSFDTDKIKSKIVEFIKNTWKRKQFDDKAYARGGKVTIDGIKFENTFDVSDVDFRKAIKSYFNTGSIRNLTRITARMDMSALQESLGDKFEPMMKYIKGVYDKNGLYAEGGNVNINETLAGGTECVGWMEKYQGMDTSSIDIEAFAGGGNVNDTECYYIKRSRWFDTHPYDIEKLKSIVEKAGGKEVHSENQYGLRNQSDVVIFKANTTVRSAIVAAIEKELNAEGYYIEIRKKDSDWVDKKRLDELYEKNKSVDIAMQDYAGELGIYDLYYGHKVDANKKRKWDAGYEYLQRTKHGFVIFVTPKGSGFKPHVWIEGGKFDYEQGAEFHAKQLRKMRDLYKKVEIIPVTDERAIAAVAKMEEGGILERLQLGEAENPDGEDKFARGGGIHADRTLSFDKADYEKLIGTGKFYADEIGGEHYIHELPKSKTKIKANALGAWANGKLKLSEKEITPLAAWLVEEKYFDGTIDPIYSKGDIVRPIIAGELHEAGEILKRAREKELGHNVYEVKMYNTTANDGSWTPMWFKEDILLPIPRNATQSKKFAPIREAFHKKHGEIKLHEN